MCSLIGEKNEPRCCGLQLAALDYSYRLLSENVCRVLPFVLVLGEDLVLTEVLGMGEIVLAAAPEPHELVKPAASGHMTDAVVTDVLVVVGSQRTSS